MGQRQENPVQRDKSTRHAQWRSVYWDARPPPRTYPALTKNYLNLTGEDHRVSSRDASELHPWGWTTAFGALLEFLEENRSTLLGMSLVVLRSSAVVGRLFSLSFVLVWVPAAKVVGDRARSVGMLTTIDRLVTHDHIYYSKSVERLSDIAYFLYHIRT